MSDFHVGDLTPQILDDYSIAFYKSDRGVCPGEAEFISLQRIQRCVEVCQ